MSDQNDDIDDFEIIEGDEYFVMDHPLEEEFDIEPGHTKFPVTHRSRNELKKCDDYDEKDEEIEKEFKDIHNTAMDLYDDLVCEAKAVEGKFKARINEVAISALNSALAATKERSRIKELKDKAKAGARSSNPTGLPDGTQVNNTQINISTTSDFIKQMADARSPLNGDHLHQLMNNKELVDNEPLSGETVGDDESKPTKRKIKRRKKSSNKDQTSKGEDNG